MEGKAFEKHDEHELGHLIDLGTRGHFPLFPSEWISATLGGNVINAKKYILNTEERDRLKKIMDKMARHKTLDKKQIILLSLSEDDRKLFIKHFFRCVEKKLLESKTGLQ